MLGPIGSGGAMIWWRRWPTHGGRGLKPLEGRAAAAHVDCCVLWLHGCVVVLCSRSTFYPFCRVEHPSKGDIFHLFSTRTNAKMLPPSPADKLPCMGELSAAVKKGGAVRLGLCFEGGKYAFFVH